MEIVWFVLVGYGSRCEAVLLVLLREVVLHSGILYIFYRASFGAKKDTVSRV